MIAAPKKELVTAEMIHTVALSLMLPERTILWSESTEERFAERLNSVIAIAASEKS